MSIYSQGSPSKQEPPDKAGAYHLIEKKMQEMQYHGETSNLRRRKQEHFRSGKYSPETHDFAWKQADGRSTSKTRREHERKKIAQHSPPHNKRAGGGGRPAKK